MSLEILLWLGLFVYIRKYCANLKLDRKFGETIVWFFQRNVRGNGWRKGSKKTGQMDL